MKAQTPTGLLILGVLLLGALPAAAAAPLANSAPTAPAGGGVESLSGSFVEFDYSGGFPPIACLRAESFTTDSEYVYNLWVKFPANWIVTDVYVMGTPSCAGGGAWGTFSWSFETWPNEVNISHPRFQAYSDHCVATYCFQVRPAAKAYSGVSWYWSGDGYGYMPHHPCSNDEYTPASMAAYPCDEAILPPAEIPAWCCHPWWWPERLETSGCNGLPQAHELELHNDYWEPLTFDLSYSVIEGDGTLTGPVTVTAGAFEAVPVDVQLTPELCAIPGTSLIAQIDATALGITWTATIVKTVLGTGGWTSRPNSAPAWTGSRGVGDGCAALNAEGQTVTYVIGGDETAQPGGLWAYHHDTNTWFQPNPGDPPDPRSEAEWAYDPETNLCYLTGGRFGAWNTNSNEAYVYDPLSDVLTALPGFATARHSHDSWLGTVDGAKMLCIGGGSAGGSVSSTQCYDVGAGTWAPENATLGPYPVVAEASADGTYQAAGGDQFWFVAGIQQYAVSDAAYYWDDADNAWHSAGHTGHGRAAPEGDFIDGAFYQMGGWYSQPLPPSATVVKGEVAGGTWTWTQLPDMPHPRQNNVAVQAGGTLWSIAGEGGTTLDYVDYVLSCPICDRQGWLTGRVADAQTGGEHAPCTDAEVRVEPGGMVLPVDPATGMYGGQLVADSYTLTVTAAGYLTETAQVTIGDDITITQDFELVRPAIEVAPAALSVTALPGVPVTVPLTIANAGQVPLRYEILELSAVQAVRDLGLPWVWEEPVSGTVLPQAGLPVSVTFQCAIGDVGQTLTGTLRVEHNDPCAEPADVPLELTCTDQVAPNIELSLSSIEPTLCSDTWAALPLSVCNRGTAPLGWMIDEMPPTAWLIESPISGTVTPNACQPVEVTFDATGLAPGEYVAGLHVSSNDPDEPEIGLPVTMTVPAPASGAVLDWSPPEPLIGETVVFTGTVAGGDPPFTFTWAFGDGATGSGSFAAHAYAGPGPFTVTLRVANDCGETLDEQVVTVRPVPPVRLFVYLPLVHRR